MVEIRMKNMDKNRYFQIRSGKHTKTKVAEDQRLYSKWLWLVMAVYKPSFADAKFGKYLTENFVCGNLSHHQTDLIKCRPDLFCQ